MPVALSWMPWIFLSVAILFEVAGITSMKLSRGFAELIPSIGVFVFYNCSAAHSAGSSCRLPMPSGPASARRSRR